MNRKLSTHFTLSRMIAHEGIDDLESLIHFTQHLPYGRNKNREDVSLVWEERKGTCSSKHAFVKKIAEENGWEDIELIIGIYKMNHINTPKIGSTLTKKGFDFIPEAHCYLKIEGQRVDITTPTASFNNIANDIMQEHKINSSQVSTYKVNLHQNFLKNWMVEHKVSTPFEEVWAIREKCIEKLSE